MKIDKTKQATAEQRALEDQYPPMCQANVWYDTPGYQGCRNHSTVRDANGWLRRCSFHAGDLQLFNRAYLGEKSEG